MKEKEENPIHNQASHPSIDVFANTYRILHTKNFYDVFQKKNSS